MRIIPKLISASLMVLIGVMQCSISYGSVYDKYYCARNNSIQQWTVENVSTKETPIEGSILFVEGCSNGTNIINGPCIVPPLTTVHFKYQAAAHVVGRGPEDPFDPYGVVTALVISGNFKMTDFKNHSLIYDFSSPYINHHTRITPNITLNYGSDGWIKYDNDGSFIIDSTEVTSP